MPKFSTSYKVAAGYIILTLLLFISIRYIYYEMCQLSDKNEFEEVFTKRRHLTNQIINQLYKAEILGQQVILGQEDKYKSYDSDMNEILISVDSLKYLIKDKNQLARLDTVQLLLKEKKLNMNKFLLAVENNKESKLYEEHINNLETYADSLLNEKRLKRKTITHQNSYVIKNKPKKFIKRLAEVFSPGKKDSIKVDNVVTEEYVDTLNNPYNLTDTVVNIFKDIQRQVAYIHRKAEHVTNQRAQELGLNGLQLSSKVNELLSNIEQEEQAISEYKFKKDEKLRENSVKNLTIIAMLAVILASIFFIIIWRDILKSTHYRKELEKEKEKAEDLLRAREQLMLTITHDIKAPVGSIIGYTDLLSKQKLDAENKSYVFNMESSAKHLLSLVNSLLDFYRLDSNKMEINDTVFSPYKLFETLYISSIPLTAAKNIEIELESDINIDDYFEGDEGRIRQIAENLISNAIKFTLKGSIKIGAHLYDNNLSFYVKDTGCGIDKDEIKSIFKEFTRLKNAQGQEGVGLGLAITYKLIRLLNGTIEIDSKPGIGTSFKVSVPLKKSKQKNNDIADNVTQFEGMNILLIDDDPIQLQLTSSMLSKLGVEAQCCNNPQDVLVMLMDTKFDMVISDIQMPAMNGFDLVNIIHSCNISIINNIPVIAVTARKDMDESYFISKGFAGSLYKPFTLLELTKKILHIINARDMGKDIYDFSPLNAFAGDDKESRLNIMTTFVRETESNIKSLRFALENKDSKQLSCLAHKILPIFRMIKAENSVLILEELEHNIKEINNDTIAKVETLLRDMENIIIVAQKFSDK